jgi:hypothetical protein
VLAASLGFARNKRYANTRVTTPHGSAGSFTSWKMPTLSLLDVRPLSRRVDPPWPAVPADRTPGPGSTSPPIRPAATLTEGWSRRTRVRLLHQPRAHSLRQKVESIEDLVVSLSFYDSA